MQDFLVLWQLWQLPSATENCATNFVDQYVHYINICFLMYHALLGYMKVACHVLKPVCHMPGLQS